MKTLKENSSHTSKDVLLHQIFDEISEEYKEVHEDNEYLDEIIPFPEERLSKIRNMQAMRQWFFIALISAAILYVLFDTDTSTEKHQEEVHKTVQDATKTPTITPIIKNKPTASPVFSLAPNKTIDRPKPQHNEMPTIQTEELSQKVMPTQKPQTPRDKAKALLRLQLES